MAKDKRKAPENVLFTISNVYQNRKSEGKPYYASMKILGKQVHLGYFATVQDAIPMIEKAEKFRAQVMVAFEKDVQEAKAKIKETYLALVKDQDWR